MKNKVFSVAFLILGIVIGAGFASGKELVTFFGSSAPVTSFLIIIMGLLIFYIVYIFIRIGKFIKPKTLSDITKAVFKGYAPIFDIVLVISLFIGVIAMLAGADAVAGDAFVDYNFPYASIILSMLVVIIVSGGLNSLLKANSVVVPIMIILVLVVTIGFLGFGVHENVTLIKDTSFIGVGSSIFSMLLYVCMNMLAVTILVAEIGPIIKNKQAKRIGLLSSLLVVMCVVLVLLSLFSSSDFIINSEMPMVKVAYNLGSVFGGIYSLVIMFGIFTTVIACGFAVNNWFRMYVKDKVLSISIVMFVAFLISRLGFGAIVELFYPIEGLFGLFFIIGVVSFYYKNRKQIRKLD